MTRKAAVFVGLTVAASWSLAAAFFGLGGRLDSSAGVLVLVAYMFVPLTSAIVVQKLVYREPLEAPLGLSFALDRWLLVAWLFPVALALATFAVTLVFPGVEYAPDLKGARPFVGSEGLRPTTTLALMALQALLTGATVNAIAAFGEEAGWRGLLQHELAPVGFWPSSLLIGLVWGVWHAPVILAGYNYPQHPWAGVGMMVVFTLLLAPILSYVRWRAGSVLAPSVLHGVLNASTGLAVLPVRGGDDLTTGVTGLPGFLVLLIADVALFAWGRVPPAAPRRGER